MAVSLRMTPRVAIRNLSLFGVIIGFAVSVPAAQLKEARVTQVEKDVKLLPTGAAVSETGAVAVTLPVTPFVVIEGSVPAPP